MKVFNLACENAHAFEGWFSSAEDFDAQTANGMLECPLCGSKSVHKTPSAPRLNLKHGGVEPPREKLEMVAAPTEKQLKALWRKLANHLVETTEDVGEQFAEEARRIHYQEAPERGIRGVATREQAAELADEGIEVFSFPMPKVRKGRLQ